MRTLICLFISLFYVNVSAESSHFIESNLSFDQISITPKVVDINGVATGLNIAHGSYVTPLHAIILSYSQHSFDGGDISTTTLFLRRRLPQFNFADFQPYINVGDARNQYRFKNFEGSLANSGLFLGLGANYAFSPKLRLNIETNLHNVKVPQLGQTTNYSIQRLSFSLGIQYTYKVTQTKK
jgi:hypothetical protein